VLLEGLPKGDTRHVLQSGRAAAPRAAGLGWVYLGSLEPWFIIANLAVKMKKRRDVTKRTEKERTAKILKSLIEKWKEEKRRK
jgi:hypothetical protein